MRVRHISVVVAAALLGLSVPAPAQAAAGDWVLDSEATFVKVVGAAPGRVADHRGNWHSFALDVDGDDDGVTGGITDWWCAPGQHPLQAEHTCERIADYLLYDAPDVVVRTSPRLRFTHISGPVELEIDSTGRTESAVLDLHLWAHGDFVRSVEVDADDVMRVDRSRDQVTVVGRVGWVSTRRPGAIATSSAVTEYAIFHRLAE